MVAGVLVSMASSNRIVCRGCFLGHSAALLPKNVYVSPPKLQCIATKKRLEMIEATTKQRTDFSIEELKNGSEVQGTKVVLNLPIQYSK